MRMFFLPFSKNFFQERMDSFAELKNLELLSAEDIQKIYIRDHLEVIDYKRALVYAIRLLSRYPNLALSPEDLVHNALEKMLDGRRVWNSVRVPNFFMFWAGCIRSIAHNEANKIEYNLTTDVIDMDLLHDSSIFSPEESLLVGSELENFLTFVKEKNPSLLSMVLAMLYKGISSPKELSKELSVDIKKINTDKKRLKRFFQRYVEFSSI